MVLDIYMLNMNGPETILLLRETDPDVKIRAISGGATKGYDVYKPARSFDAQVALVMPFGAKEFLAHVERLLNDLCEYAEQGAARVDSSSVVDSPGAGLTPPAFEATKDNIAVKLAALVWTPRRQDGKGALTQSWR